MGKTTKEAGIFGIKDIPENIEEARIFLKSLDYSPEEIGEILERIEKILKKNIK